LAIDDWRLAIGDWRLAMFRLSILRDVDFSIVDLEPANRQSTISIINRQSQNPQSAIRTPQS